MRFDLICIWKDKVNCQDLSEESRTTPPVDVLELSDSHLAEVSGGSGDDFGGCDDFDAFDDFDTGISGGIGSIG